MSKNSRAVQALYTTAAGRAVLKVLQACGASHLAAAFLHSSLSRPLIRRYISRYDIPMEEFEGVRFPSFGAFFARKKKSVQFDAAPDHLISPCDGWLSVYPIEADSSFAIKGSRYRVCDLLQNAGWESRYDGGLCLVIRLCPSDYHHYCYLDDGYQGENHFIAGQLHSVQPIACETYPVYTLNRRVWTLMQTDHFGPVVQTEIGALIVGGICCEHENVRVQKGMEMGHFELAGSTIVLLFEKERVALSPAICKEIPNEREIRVTQGMWIGTRYDRKEQRPVPAPENGAGADVK